MGYAVDQKSQMHSELGLLMPRLKAFAAALTGSEAMSLTLLKATRNHLLSRPKDRGHTPLVLWAFTQMHTLWAGRMKPPRGERSPQADPRLFCPRSRASDSGGAVRFARLIAQLGPQQRATLHLVYGERLSYDEVAEVFGVPVGTVMTRLSRAHALLAQIEEHEPHAVEAGAAAQHGQPQSERGVPRPGRAA
jgi:RNA polymerase sigma-70 factor (ECF subfamily)